METDAVSTPCRWVEQVTTAPAARDQEPTQDGRDPEDPAGRLSPLPPPAPA